MIYRNNAQAALNMVEIEERLARLLNKRDWKANGTNVSELLTELEAQHENEFMTVRFTLRDAKSRFPQATTEELKKAATRFSDKYAREELAEQLIFLLPDEVFDRELEGEAR